MPLSKFESMLKTNSIYFFDLAEFEEIIIHYLDTGKHSLAKKAVKLGLEQHPTSVDLRLLEVEILIFDNHLELASKKILKIEQLVPNNEEVYCYPAPRRHDAFAVHPSRRRRNVAREHVEPHHHGGSPRFGLKPFSRRNLRHQQREPEGRDCPLERRVVHR